ncbi:MAG: MgtC/SapB family protein [bacterium]|nr:MgtC/SapB family protein [bacterium]
MEFVQVLQSQALGLDPLPFLVAIAVGGAIGLERELHGRPAGLRTHVLVCLSSTVLIYASRSLPLATAAVAGSIVFDPNRLASGIVTGIGFLGAAAVIRSGDIVRGITTGACVWAVACLGVVIGQGHYAVAITGAFTMLVVLVLFDRLFAWVTPVVYRKLVIQGREVDLAGVRDRATALLREAGVVVQDVSCRVREGARVFDLTLHVRSRSSVAATDVVAKIANLEGVEAAEWGSIEI